jgi:uncharacterized membrane protein
VIGFVKHRDKLYLCLFIVSLETRLISVVGFVKHRDKLYHAY